MEDLCKKQAEIIKLLTEIKQLHLMETLIT